MANFQWNTANLESIMQNSKMALQEDCYDTPEVQAHIRAAWEAQKTTLIEMQYWDQEKKDKYSLEKIKKIVDYAFVNVPFYNRIYRDSGYEVGGIQSLSDFKALPAVNKAMLKAERLEDLMSAEYVNNLETLFWSSTSGSSGASLPIANNIDTVTAVMLSYFRIFSMATRGQFSRASWIYNIHHIRGWTSSLLGDYPTFTLNDIRDVEEFIQHLEHIRPAIITTLPSYLPLMEPYADRIKNIGLSAIITNSEMSSQYERDHYSKLYGVPITDDFSSEEVGIMAVECQHRKYHPQFDFVHLYFEGISEGLFRSYATDLTARTMPFIKYDHGDVLSIEGGASDICECGICGPRIVSVEGRKDDCLKTTDGRYVPTAIVTNTLDSFFNSAASGVDSFRLIQHSDVRSFTFEYVGHSSQPSGLIGDFKTELSKILDMDISLRTNLVDKLKEGKSFKRKKIICEVA